MKRIERTYFVAEFLSSYFDKKLPPSVKITFADWMLVADKLIEIACSPESVLLNLDDDDIRYRNVADALKNPFEILEYEFKNMGMGESSDMNLDESDT